MLANAHPDLVDVRDRDLRRARFRSELLERQLEQPLRPDAQDQLGQRLRVARLERDQSRPAARADPLQLVDVGGGLLVRLVLQEAGEEQVAGLQQRQVLLVLHLGGREQTGRLQVQQGGRDQQELTGLVEIPVVAHGPDVRNELVGHHVQGDLGDIQLVLADQLQQQVERALEVVQLDLELAGIGLGGRSDDRVIGRGRRQLVLRHRLGRLFKHVPTVDHPCDNALRAHALPTSQVTHGCAW